MGQKDEVKTGKKHLMSRMLDEKSQLSSKQSGGSTYDIQSATKTKEDRLAAWVEEQRALYRKGKLSEEQVRKLKDAGVALEHETALWEVMFLQMKEYKAVQGDCMVPANYIPNPILARWVAEQRDLYMKGRLAQERADRLAELEFVFDIETYNWDVKFQQLMEFKEQHGHGNVPEHIGITKSDKDD